MSGSEQPKEADDNIVLFGVPDAVRAALDRVADPTSKRLLLKMFRLRSSKVGEADAIAEITCAAKSIEILCRTAGQSGRHEARVQLTAKLATLERGDGFDQRLRDAAQQLLKAVLFAAWLVTKPGAWIAARVRAYPIAAAFLAYGAGCAVTIYSTQSVRDGRMPVAFDLPEPGQPHFSAISAVRHAGRVFVDAREPGSIFLETITDDGRIAAIYKCAASHVPPPRVEDILVVVRPTPRPPPVLGPRPVVEPRILYDCRHKPDATALLKREYADGRPIPVGRTSLSAYKQLDTLKAREPRPEHPDLVRATPHNIPDAATVPVIKSTTP